MRRNFPDLPQWRDSRKIPFTGLEGIQKIDQFFVHSAQQMSTDDRGQRSVRHNRLKLSMTLNQSWRITG
jgi:hypothetical protein